MREVMGDALSKRLARILDAARNVSLSPEKLATKLEHLPLKLPRDYLEAVRGDSVAVARLEAQGLWEPFLLGLRGSIDKLRPHDAYLLKIERACAEPVQLIRQGRNAAAADLLRQDPIMTRILWPKAASRLRQARNPISLAPLQLSLALEAQLGFLAAWDTHLQQELTENGSLLTDVVPSSDRNPSSRLFDWLKKEAGDRSCAKLLEGDTSTTDVSTLQRWNRGAHFPSTIVFKRLVKAVFVDADHKPAWARFSAAKHLQFLGSIAELAIKRTTFREDQGDSNWPWPELPHGHASFETWATVRYAAWLDYHSGQAV